MDVGPIRGLSGLPERAPRVDGAPSAQDDAAATARPPTGAVPGHDTVRTADRLAGELRATDDDRADVVARAIARLAAGDLDAPAAYEASARSILGVDA